MSGVFGAGPAKRAAAGGRWRQRRWRYRRLAGDPYHYGGYSLTALREEDIQKIREWRNAQRSILRQKAPIEADAQQQYYRSAVVPSFFEDRPKLILLSLLHRNRCCGYTGLTNLDWEARRGEISFLVNPERALRPARYAADFSCCLIMLKAIAFGELGLNRLFAESYDLRPHHVAVLESSGFEFEGRMRNHVMIDGALVDSLIHGALREDWRVGD